MKFLHVIATVDPRSGGPIEGVLRPVDVLASHGHTRAVVSLDHPLDPWVSSCPIPVFPMGARPTRNRRRWNWLPWVHYGYTSNLVPWLKAHAHEYDAVVVNGLWNYCALAARRTLVKSSVPYFVFTHGMLDPWFRQTYPLKHFLKQILWYFSEGPLLANARGVLFTTEEERVLARGVFRPYRIKERVVGYGTADVIGDPLAQGAAFRTAVPQLGKRRFLLFMSRIHPKKGCDLLIGAFAKLAAKHVDLDLVMAGPDQLGLVATLKRLAGAAGIADRVHWPGMLQGANKWGALRECEAFVLPSHQENFGIVVAEALACGRPVLISDKVNIWREIEAAGAGFVAPDRQDDIEGMLRKYLALDVEQRSAMGAAARRVFLSHFDIRANIERLLAVLLDHGK